MSVPPPRRGSLRYDADDYHDPTRGIGGSAPARSALTLRTVLAVFGLLFCAGAAIAGIEIGAPVAFDGVLAGLSFLALLDLAFIARRYRTGPL